MMDLKERTTLRNKLNNKFKETVFEGFEYFGQSKDGILFMNEGGQAFTIKTIVHTEKVDVFSMVEEYELNVKEQEKKAKEKEAKKNKREAKENKEKAE